MNLRVLSTYDLDRQITSDDAPWLDRELISPNRTPLTQAGFGSEVSRALERRKDRLVDQGPASRTPEGGVRAPRDLLSILCDGRITWVQADIRIEFLRFSYILGKVGRVPSDLDHGPGQTSLTVSPRRGECIRALQPREAGR